MRPNLATYRQSIGCRHVDVEQYEVGRFTLERLQCRRPIAGCTHVESRLGQREANQCAQIGIVIGNQNLHGSYGFEHGVDESAAFDGQQVCELLGVHAQFAYRCRFPVISAQHRPDIEQVRTRPAIGIDDGALRTGAQSQSERVSDA